VPRRSRRQIVGKWERIEQEDRDKELKELERELHGEQERDTKPKPKHRWRRQQQKTEPGAQDKGTARNTGTDDTSSDG
jgi:hypothetical protein